MGLFPPPAPDDGQGRLQRRIETPRQAALPHDIFRDLGAQALMAGLGERIGYPLIVKPSHSSNISCAMA